MNSERVKGAVVNALIFVGVLGGFGGAVTAWYHVGPWPTDVSQTINRTDIDLHVEAEFQYHGTDCVVVSVNDPHLYNSKIAAFVDCGHGLDPTSPSPHDGGATTYDIWTNPSFTSR